MILNNVLNWIFDTKYDPSGNSNLSFDLGADTLTLLFCMSFLCFSTYSKCKDLIRQHTFFSSSQVFLSIRLSNNLCREEVLLFSELMNIIYIF